MNTSSRLALVTGLLSTIVLLGCGGGDARKEEEPPAPSALAVTLRVALELPDSLARSCEQWATERRARIEWIGADAGEVERATLREIDADELDRLLASDALRPFAGDARASVDAVWLGSTGLREDRVWGLPWRSTLFAVAGTRLNDWSDLGRAGSRCALQDDAITDAFLALAAAGGGMGSVDSVQVFDASSADAREALSFLVGVVGRSTRATAEQIDALTDVDHALRRVGVGAEVTWSPLPSPEGDAAGAVLARPRLLVVPRGGDHPDLGAELARWLAAPERSQRLLEPGASRVPLHRDVTGSDASTRALLDLRALAIAAPWQGADAATWNALLEEAVHAAVERRRNPDTALDDAIRRRGERSEP